MATNDDVHGNFQHSPLCEADIDEAVTEVDEDIYSEVPCTNEATDFQDDDSWDSFSSDSEYSCTNSETDKNIHIYENLQKASIDEANTDGRVSTSTPNANLEEIKQKRITKRFHVLQELIDTERDFLNDVNITINDIMNPLFEHEFFLEIQVKTIFGNITEIRDFSTLLLASLEKLEFASPQANPDRTNVGKVFTDHIPQMVEVYKAYCLNHDDAAATLEKLEKEPDFQLPLQECLNNVKTKVNTFDLGSFLLKPVQRVRKYPLLLNELLKTTEPPEPPADCACYRDLMAAVRHMEKAVKQTNGKKRKKDFVRRYRNREILSGNFLNVSFDSVKKAAELAKSRLSRATSIGMADEEEKKFIDLEKKLKIFERSVKTFLENCRTCFERYVDWFKSEQVLLEDLSEISLSHNTMIVSLQAAVERINNRLVSIFKDQLQLRIVFPLLSLLDLFKGPQAVTAKRFSKLPELESILKRHETKDNTLAAREVLNQQWLEEIPKLLKLSEEVLMTCMAVFIELIRRVQEDVLKELSLVVPNSYVFSTVVKEDEALDLQEGQDTVSKSIEVFHEFSVKSFSTSSRASTSSFELYWTAEKTKPTTAKSKDCTKVLLDKYPVSSLYVATNAHQPSNEIDLSCTIDQLFAVIKPHDPMGNTERWLVDNGDEKGLLPASCLRQLDVSHLFSKRSLSTEVATANKENVHSLQQPNLTDVRSNDMQNNQNTSMDTTTNHLANEHLSQDGDLNSESATQPAPIELRHVRCYKPKLMKKPNIPKKTPPQSYAKVLHEKYPASSLYKVVKAHQATGGGELSCTVDQVLAVIETQDQNGSSDWWLVDSGEKQGFLPGLNLQQLEHHHQSPTSPQPQKTHVTSRQSLECRPRPPIPPKPRLASVTSPSKLKHSNVVDLTTNTQSSTNVNLSQSQRLMLQNGIQATPRGMEDLPYKTKTAAKPHLQKSIPSRPDDSKDKKKTNGDDLISTSPSAVNDDKRMVLADEYLETGEIEKNDSFRVTCDYSSQSEHELSVREGEILTLITSDHQEWWYMANSEGKEGYVPANYIENAN